MSKQPRKPPFQFGLRSLFMAMFLISVAHWALNASRDALVLLGIAIAYVFMIMTVLYLDPSRDS
jgi:F0F1-type ATP synthase membrane subunit a